MIRREVVHEKRVSGDADRIYRFLSDVTLWADIFPPTIYAEQIEREGDQELVHIWASANGTVRNWQSRRTLNSTNRQIRFAQARPTIPVESMAGTWEVIAEAPGQSLVKLSHAYAGVTEEDTEFIAAAVESNSERELSAVASFFGVPDRSLVHGRVEDTIPVSSSVSDAFKFLLEADLWSERIPHVAGATLTRFDGGGEYLRLVTRAKDSSEHQTASYRVELPGSRLVYKQVQTPGALVSHRGEWRVFAADGTTYVTSVHEFELTEESVAAALGPDVTLKEAQTRAGEALKFNSAETIKLIDAWTDKVPR